MSSEKHPNLNLHKLSATDSVLSTELNENVAKLDENVATVNTQLAESTKKLTERWISVIDSPYNAKGDWDGTTGMDNTSAIQYAINDAVPGTTIIIPYMANQYKVDGTITLKSNIEIICFGELYLPSSSSYRTVFTGGNGITNFKTSGISVISVNDKTRAIGRSGLGSNIILFSLSNCSGVTIDDTYGENLEYFLKVDINSSDFVLNKIETKNVFQPIYSVDLSVLRGKAWKFDCPLTGDSHDHHLHVNGSNEDWIVDDITFVGGTGQSFQISATNNTKVTNKNLHFTNIKINDVVDAFIVTAGSNITFDHVHVKGIATGRYVLGLVATSTKLNENITLSNFVLENIRGSLVSGLTGGAFYPKNVTFKDGILKGQTGGHVINPLGTILFDNVEFTEAQSKDGAARLIFLGATSDQCDLTLNNCRIVYETVAPSEEPISVRATSNYNVTIKNSKIINKQTTYSAINYNMGTGTVLFKNNEYKGFTRIKVATYDTTTIANSNFNMDTKTVV